MNVRRNVWAVIEPGRAASRRWARSALAADGRRDDPAVDVAKVTTRAVPCWERGLVRPGVGPRGAVREQFVVQPRGHVHLADSRLGLGIAHVNHAVREVQVADVEIARLGSRIDVLVYSGMWLWDTVPRFHDRLLERITAGVLGTEVLRAVERAAQRKREAERTSEQASAAPPGLVWFNAT